MPYSVPLKSFKTNIRGLNINKIKYSAATSLPFLKSENGNTSSLFALEVLYNIPKNYSEILQEQWGDVVNDMELWAETAEKLPCDILALKFNIENENETENALKTFKQIQKNTKKTLLITGTNKKEIDSILLPELAKAASAPCIIGIAEQDNYKELSKIVAEKRHYIIARTPIDINLAKELNILLTDSGVSPDKIIIDTNVASLGYGLDYGYSIIEKVRLAGLNGDETLNMPIIAFVGEESWKAKEARVNNFTSNYGNFKERALVWESATAISLMLAGANIIVLWHPETLKALKSFQEEI